MLEVVLVLGGYGVFGSRISMALARVEGIDLIVAGRDRNAAVAFCAVHGGRPDIIDREDPALAARIASLSPFLVIDAAGPFQSYGARPYRVAEAALAAGAHYLDLSDDPAFTIGIARLDDVARKAGLAVLSGVSSVPALSSAAVVDLAEDMDDIHLVDTVILPGNRAPRGLSVVRAIVGQAGRPIRMWRGGRSESVPGWSGLECVSLSLSGKPPLSGRWASVNAAPDLELFPRCFRARSVVFRAGLELKTMHAGLLILSMPVRWGLLGSIAPLARPLKWVAERLKPFGTDAGGMRVCVSGLTRQGRAEVRAWVLLAGSGEGPHVPAVPARVMFERLLAGKVPPGARPCVAEFALAEAEAAMANLDISTESTAREFPLVFAETLGAAFGALPPAVRDLHTVMDVRRWSGEADVEEGTGHLARLVRMLMGFPAPGTAIPVKVRMERRGEAEIWERRFAGRPLRSRLARAGAGILRERFGPLSFDIALNVVGGRLAYPVVAGYCAGLPLPRALLPISETIESMDAEGRVTFDVAISLPRVGRIVRYRGWLVPDEAEA
ncbi:SDR family oxidoreductase [Xanthobacter sp. YC-JY1]|uniref:SDR family oxidoreductase n=1 Tax=Xanthobacter sp. YC-JY1 TaxID=2419844 RepID=UPI001F25DACA|nr:SDR family oxidoreductase [Xanthobacter sp. YC-JY1]